MSNHSELWEMLGCCLCVLYGEIHNRACGKVHKRVIECSYCYIVAPGESSVFFTYDVDIGGI